MKKIYATYKELAKKYDWKVVECAEGNFVRNSTDIFEDILPLVEEILLRPEKKEETSDRQEDLRRSIFD